MPKCELCDLGRINYEDALEYQRLQVGKRRLAQIPDQFLIVEHPHTITLGRRGKQEHLLAGEEVLRRAGIHFHHTDRGGDITYHGPGQIVGYPIIDLREWKRDVAAYVRSLEQVIIDAMAEFGIAADRVSGLTGVWVDGAKVAAIGVHITRWITYHGFALNVDTDLSYFQYIVPCGLSQPVTSMVKLGSAASRGEVISALSAHFGRIFDREVTEREVEMEKTT